MNIWRSSFDKAFQENERNTQFYEHQKKAFQELSKNLKRYNEILSPSIMVPVCKGVLMKGNLIHTNEVLVSLGCDYFVKVSSRDAQGICQRRLSNAEEMLKNLEDEYNFLNDQIDFSEKNILSHNCSEIIEDYDEEREKQWRVKHRESQKSYREKDNREREAIDDNALMNKLDLLELQEEIEASEENQSSNKKVERTEQDFELKEFSLRKKLSDLKQRKKVKCETEEDLMKRLDQLEEEEELEDELDRLCQESLSENSDGSEEGSSDSTDTIINYDEIKENKNKPNLNEIEENDKLKIKRKVSFGDDSVVQYEDVETLQINFEHSDMPSHDKNPSANTDIINSPSDVYSRFPECFNKRKKSIIKNCHKVKSETHNLAKLENMSNTNESSDDPVSGEVLLGDVIEHRHENTRELNDSSNISQPRQISKFKSMRLAQKKLSNQK